MQTDPREKTESVDLAFIVDAILVAAILVAFARGWRQGALSAILSALGIVAGLVVGLAVAPLLVNLAETRALRLAILLAVVDIQMCVPRAHKHVVASGGEGQAGNGIGGRRLEVVLSAGLAHDGLFDAISVSDYTQCMTLGIVADLASFSFSFEV